MFKNIKWLSRLVDIWCFVAIGVIFFRLGAGKGSWLWWSAIVWMPAAIFLCCYLIALILNWRQKRHNNRVL